MREAISGNLCRCTGYEGIIKSIMAAAKGEVSPRAPSCGDVGKGIPMREAGRFTRGQGRYVTTSRSPTSATSPSHAVTRRTRVLTSIDVKPRASSPTRSRCSQPRISSSRRQPRTGAGGAARRQADYFPLAREKVRWVGEPIAAVVATKPLPRRGHRRACRHRVRPAPCRRRPRGRARRGQRAALRRVGQQRLLPRGLRRRRSRRRLRERRRRRRAALLRPAPHRRAAGDARHRRRLRPGHDTHAAWSPTGRTSSSLGR